MRGGPRRGRCLRVAPVRAIRPVEPRITVIDERQEGAGRGAVERRGLALGHEAIIPCPTLASDTPQAVAAAAEAVSVGVGPPGWALATASWRGSEGWVSLDGLTWHPVPSGWPGVSLFFAPPLTVRPGSIATAGRWNRVGTDEWISAVVIGTIRR